MVSKVDLWKNSGRGGKKLRRGPLLKEFWRTILASLPRFISLALILLMGTAFFTGLKATAPSMVSTVTEYMDVYDLADFAASTNYGLTEADVRAFEKRPEVRAAAGVMTLDVLVDATERQDVLRLHSLPEGGTINRPALVSGRLPRDFDEISPDYNWASRVGCQVGDEINLAVDGAQKIKTRHLKVVGLTVTPDYLATDRGSSQAGNGKVACFAFVDQRLFESDVYTAVLMRVKLSDRARQGAFEDIYTEATAALRPGLEAFVDERAEARRQTIYQKAEEKLDEAATELADGRREAEDQLRSARKKLDDGHRSYEEGLAVWQAGRIQWEDGKRQAEDGLKAAAAELALQKSKLEENRTLLEKAGGSRALEAGLTELEKVAADLAIKRTELSAAQADLNEKWKSWQALQEQYKKKLGPLDGYEPEPSPSTSQPSATSSSSASESRAGSATSGGSIQVKGTTPASGSVSVTSLAPPTAGESSRPAMAPVTSKTAGTFEIATTSESQPTSPSQTAPSATSSGESAELIRLKAAYEQGKAAEPALLQAMDQVKTGLDQLAQGEAELAAQRTRLLAAKTQQEDALRKLDAGAQAIREGERQLAEQEKKVGAQLEAGWAELVQGERELQEAALDLTAGEERYAEEEKRAAQKLADGETDLAEGRDQLKEMKPAEGYLLDREANIGFASFKQDSDRIETLSLIFPLIFYAVAALVSMTTMTRMVEEERGRIGSFHALGYSKKKIYLKYFGYAALAAGLGASLGLLIGYRLFPDVIYRAYGLLYDLPPLKVSTYRGIDMLALALAFISALGGVFSVAVKTIREQPAELLRPPAPKDGQRIFLEHIRPLWRRLSFNSKVTFRNIFLYKKRMWMTLIGIAGCTSLLVMGFGLKDSMRSIGVMQYGPIIQADAVLTLDKKMAKQGELSIDAIHREDFVKDVLPIYEQPVTCLPPNFDPNRSVGDQTYIGNTALTVPLEADRFSDFFHLKDPQRGQAVSFDTGQAGVLLTDKLARKLGVGPGDHITLEPSLSANDRLETNRDLLLLKEGVDVPVAGIVEFHYGHRIFMLPGVLEKICSQQSVVGSGPSEVESTGELPGAEAPYPTRYYLQWIDQAVSAPQVSSAEAGAGDPVEGRSKLPVAGSFDENRAAADLLKHKGISACGLFSEEKSMLMSRADRIGAVLLIIILAAALLAYVVLFNLSTINLTERRRELATLKVLGFTKRELNNYIFRENIILTFLGTLLGLGLGTAFHHYLVRSVESDQLSMSLRIAGLSFLWSAALTVAFSLLVNLQMLPRLQKIDMVESLKSVE